jgi:hypothetical protein
VLYGSAAAIVIVSYLLWYDFNRPPVGSNWSFNLFPQLHYGLALSLFTPYYWPGSFIPPGLGTPLELYYGAFYAASGKSYSLALFGSVVTLGVLGGLSLTYFIVRWLGWYRAPRMLGLFGVLIYSFNAYTLLNGYGTYGGYFSTNLFAPGDPAPLLILAFLTYLTLFRSRTYALVLGVASFFMFSAFPFGTATLAEEYLVVLVVLLGYRVFHRSADPTCVAARRHLATAGLIVGVICLANFYFFFPFLAVGQLYFQALGSPNPVYTFSFAFDSIQTLHNSTRLISNWALNSPFAPAWYPAYSSNPWIQALLYGIPFMAFAAGLFIKRIFEILGYAGMIVLTVLSASSNPPIGGFFVWLITSVPFLRPFYNGETFSPLLLVLYCAFGTFTLYQLLLIVRKTSVSHRFDDRISNRFGRRRSSLIRKGLEAALVVALALAIVIGPVYPALSRSYTEGNPSTAVSSSLPTFYGQANGFLQSQNPNAPVMVFPGVKPFNSNLYNNVTWYSGLNIYPLLIPNPSISSSYPPNYTGGLSTYPVPGFVYSLGSRVCLDCSTSGSGPNYVPSTGGQSPHFSVAGSILRSPYPPQASVSGAANNTSIQWSVGSTTDSLAVVPQNGSSIMEFTLNAAALIPNGHWLVGSFASPQNLSLNHFAILTYELSGLDPRYLQFGYHTIPGKTGIGFITDQYTTYVAGSNFTTVIPIDWPAIPGGGLAHVADLYFVYNPPFPGSGKSTLSVSSVRFSPGSGDGHALLASDLGRMGVELAYVDTSIVDQLYPAFAGNYYNVVFSNSQYFQKIFQSGSVTIYKDLLYRGLFQAISRSALLPSVHSLFEGVSFNYTPIYYNVSNSNVTFVTSSPTSLALLGQNASITSVNKISPTDFRVGVESGSPFLLTFRAGFDNAWRAQISGISVALPHVQIDGLSNGWIVPAGHQVVEVSLRGEASYRVAELLTFVTPIALGVALLFLLVPKVGNGGGLVWLREYFRLRYLGHGFRRKSKTVPAR